MARKTCIMQGTTRADMGTITEIRFTEMPGMTGTQVSLDDILYIFLLSVFREVLI